jgi:hypothetical protein
MPPFFRHWPASNSFLDGTRLVVCTASLAVQRAAAAAERLCLAAWERIVMILKSVGVVSVGKVLGCLYALLGLIVGALFSLLALAGLAIGRQQQNQPQGLEAMVMGVGAIIILPIFYGLVGFIGGIISAALYNLVASVVGGIELDIRGDAHDDWEEGDREPN